MAQPTQAFMNGLLPSGPKTPLVQPRPMPGINNFLQQGAAKPVGKPMIDPKTGQLNPVKALAQAPGPFTGMESETVQRNRDAAYNYITKDYATNKAQESEAIKQELANRGIPYDPNPNSLYGRTAAQLDKKYQAMDDQAKNQAFSAGLGAAQAESQISSTQLQDYLRKILGISGQNTNVYGIEQGNATIVGGAAPGFS